MRMDEMDSYLMKHGFNVRREYDSMKDVYIFTIEKDDHQIRCSFEYRGSESWVNRNVRQKEFLNDIIHIYNREYGLKDYIDADMNNTKELYKRMANGFYGRGGFTYMYIPEIKNVIFNDPATIVFWSDNTKTVVKCEHEAFDCEKGLAMAIAKKAMGNKGNYYNKIKKWIPELEVNDGRIPFTEMCKRLEKLKEIFREKTEVSNND